MLLNDPVILLAAITPFGLMTTLLLCLSYLGLGKHNTSLHWWLAGDLLIAAYHVAALLQPGVPSGALAWLPVFSPAAAHAVGTTLLITAVGAHTLALCHLLERGRSRRWHLRMLLGVPAVYLLGTAFTLHGAYAMAWFCAAMFASIAIQARVTCRMARSYRGAWGLLAGQAVLLAYQGSGTVMLVLHPLPPLPFHAPFFPSIDALLMDALVSFLLTLSYALALQEQLRQRIVSLSRTDSLTGALNRRGAGEIVEAEWQRARTNPHPLAIAMIDLDRFKGINDQYGHAIGDAALQAFSNTVLRLKRQSDVLVRWGGEEFLVLLPHTDVTQAHGFLQRLRDALHAGPVTPWLPFTLEFSAGVADTDTLASIPDFDALLREVDQALYRAKRERNRIEVVSPA
ncbi:GGDEF domain-containing protein [Cupriavidus agavae]|uniref:diguanylate cyclase n=1 Tax=Cupriavidus agavae TaxID=1001822 RepID=A0A4Q7S0F5_9BURK|nr:GGDEF domain-containing protein [Cupriavidus agavae]RZT39604.1 diguanylate cyclase (GGDEF)-like protein [Cupriavidus agavae]